jgi:hypothetical protein
MPYPLTDASSNHETASPDIHRGGWPSRARGNRGHPSPSHEGCGPSDTEMPGGSPSASDHEQTHRVKRRKDPSRSVDGVDHRPVPVLDQQMLPSWRPTTETVGRCDAGTEPRFGTVAARPAAWLETRGSRVAASQRTSRPATTTPSDTHRDERFDDGLARVRRPSPATSLTSEERSITRTFARAVRSVSPPRDFTTWGCDQRPKTPFGGSNMLRATTFERQTTSLASATDARMTSRRGCPKAPTTSRIQRPPQRLYQQTESLDELGAPSC